MMADNVRFTSDLQEPLPRLTRENGEQSVIQLDGLSPMFEKIQQAVWRPCSLQESRVVG
jgi:hypothetical protein